METRQANTAANGNIFHAHAGLFRRPAAVRTASGLRMTQMAGLLDALRCAVMLSDARAAILYANRAATAMLQEASTLRAASGRIDAVSPDAARDLRAAIRRAAQFQAEPAGSTVRLTEEGDARLLFAHVLPLEGASRPGGGSSGAAEVFIANAPDATSEAQAAARAFGLTPAETRLLARLLSGGTLTAAAVALGIAPTTARTHLYNIFAKTGVSRQSDLLRVVRQAVPPATTGQR